MVSGAVRGFFFTPAGPAGASPIAPCQPPWVLLLPLRPQTTPGGRQQPGLGSGGHQGWDRDRDSPTPASPQAQRGRAPGHREGGAEGSHHHDPAGVKSASGWGGTAGPSEDEGRGCCTKQACVSLEWVALSNTGPGPYRIGPGCPAPDPPVWGGVATVTGSEATGLAFAQPRPWPPHGDVRVSGGQRAVEGLPDLPLGRAPTFPGLRRVSPKSPASSSSLLAPLE